MLLICLLGVLPVVVRGPAAEPGSAVPFDILIRGGTVYDGSGRPPRRADVAICGDQVVAIGDLVGAAAKSVVDANGLAVAPGFINMLTDSSKGRKRKNVEKNRVFGYYTVRTKCTIYCTFHRISCTNTASHRRVLVRGGGGAGAVDGNAEWEVVDCKDET
jgi:N-acyl-D-aspartate/D-glutamate deacylase